MPLQLMEEMSDESKQLRTKNKKLELKLSQIEAKKARLGNKLRSQESRADTRRKILVGAWAIDLARKENRLDELYKMVSGCLTRDVNKKLFKRIR